MQNTDDSLESTMLACRHAASGGGGERFVDKQVQRLEKKLAWNGMVLMSR